MKKILLLFILIGTAFTSTYSQNLSYTCPRDTILACGASCLSISSNIPDIHSLATDYSVVNISSQASTCYPLVNPGTPGPSAGLTIDDRYSNAITLPFTFPFYGTNYNSLVISANGYLSFDVSQATLYSHWTDNGNLPNTLYDKALIMGPYHDLYPGQPSSPSQQIKYETIGTAPNRRFIVSYYKLPMFDCTSLIENTHQIILYESSGIIEVFIQDMQICNTWNGGKAMVGLQNFAQNQGIMAPNRRMTDAPWGSIGMREAWRFIPKAGPTTYRSVDLLDGTGAVVAPGDTVRLNPTTFLVNFNNVCPPPNSTTPYVVRTTYANILTPATTYYSLDTIMVTRQNTLPLDSVTTLTTCGGSSGTIRVTASGGTPGYEYSIDGGVTWVTVGLFTGLPQGVYTINSRDAAGCIGSIQVTLNAIANIPGTVASTATGCPGVNNGTITVTPTGGTGPYTFSLDGGTPGNSNVITGVSAGPHTVVFTDANGCSGVVNTNVGAGSSIASSSSTTGASCPGAANGSATITPTNGTGPYSYSLDGGAFVTTNVFTGLTGGSHTVQIKDASGCTGTRTFFISTGTGLAFAPATSTPESCPGSANGTIAINLTNGTAPFQYSIDGGTTWQASNTFTGLSGGIKVINFKDVNGCTGMQTVPLSTGTGFPANATSTPTTCPGAPNGTITATVVSGGTAPFTYSIDGGTFQASNTFTGVVDGAHVIIVKDASGCQSTINHTVPAGGTPIAGTTTSTPAACSGVATGSITVTATSGSAPYQYSIDGGTTWQASNTFNSILDGTHTITIKDNNGCTGTVTETVGFGSSITGTSTSTATACPGASNASITVTATSGSAPYQYSIDGGTTWQAGNTLTGLASGAHTITIKDNNGCTGTVSATVTDGAALTATATSTATACPGSTSGSITVTPTNGTGPYQYSDDSGTTWQTSNIFTGLPSGTHTIDVKDANGCTGTVSATITDGASLTATATSTATACPGSSSGSITVTPTNGTGPYQYSSDGGTTYQASNTLTGFAAGAHTITVKDVNGCIGSVSATVTDGAALTATAVPSPTACPGVDNGAITVTPNNGLAPFQFSIDGGTTWQNSNIISGLAPGAHTVTVKDAGGCIGTVSATVTAGTNLLGTATSTASSCTVANNGSITVNITNGTAPYQYSKDGGTTFQPSNTFNNLLAASYTISFKDATGCTGSTTVTVGTGTGLTGSATTTATSCPGVNNGTITATIDAGIGLAPFSYELDGTTTNSTGIFNNITAGAHAIIVTDALGCTVTINAAVTSGAAITGTADNIIATTCPGVDNGAVTITPSASATAPFTFALDGGANQASPNFAGLSGGAHTVLLADANGCTATINFNIGTGAVMTGTATNIQQASCSVSNDGAATITPNTGAVAPFSFSMDGGAAQNNATFTGLSSGAHTATFTDANGCVGTVNFTVGAGGALTGTAAPQATSCPGVDNGSVVITATTGVAPYMFSLDGGTPQASNTFTGLNAGTHVVTFTDNLGCPSGNINANITSGAAITLSATPVAASCPGVDNGTVSLAPGATANAPYTFNVDGGLAQVSPNFSNLSTGAHTANVTDANGCQATTNFNIGVGAALTGTKASTATSCPGVNNGTLTVTPTSGTGPYQYSLDGGAAQPNGTFTNLAAGTYNVTFTDAIGCSGTVSNIVVNEGVSISSTVASQNPPCFGINNGSIVITPTSGAAPYTYSINGGASQPSSTFSNLSPNTYNILITDAVGCTGNNSTTLVTNPDIVLNTIENNPLCFNGTDGSIIIKALGGVAPFEYSINAGVTYQATDTFKNLNQGNYTIRVRDNVGCVKSINASLTHPTKLTATSTTSPSTCIGGDGDITINATGGTPNYTYSVDNGTTFPFQTSNSFTVGKGAYNNIVVKDNNNCTTTISAIVGEIDDMLPLFIGSDTTVCQDEPLTFNPAVDPLATVFTWTGPNIDNPNILNAVVTPQDTATYILAAYKGACQRLDTIIINVKLRPIPDAGPDQRICLDDSTTISGSVSHTSGTVNYSWAPPDLVHDANTQTTIAVPGGTQYYILTVTDNYGCNFSETDSVLVIMQPLVPAYAGGDTIVTMNLPFNLVATGGEQYLWSTTSPTANITNPTSDRPLIVMYEDARFMVKVIDIAGCIGFDTVYVQVMVGPNYYVPNAFSPNGDGLNDIFRPIPVGMTRPEYFRVFNRFGELVFETNQYLKGWDGTYKGKPVDLGTYIWILKGEDRRGKTIEMKGTVIVVR